VIPDEGARRDALVLHHDLESFTHSLRVDQRLKQQPRASFALLVRSGHLDIRKVRPACNSQEEIRLRSQTARKQTAPPAPQIECREIDVRRKVLLARGPVKIFARAVTLVGQQRAAQVALVV
jgi:hypothetical protein